MSKSVFPSVYEEYPIADIPNAWLFTSKASDVTYYNNLHFQRLLGNWTKYLEYEPKNNDALMEEWRDVLIEDFYKHGLEWLKSNRKSTFWRKDLK